jgi:hypothetical protein
MDANQQREAQKRSVKLQGRSGDDGTADLDRALSIEHFRVAVPS